MDTFNYLQILKRNVYCLLSHLLQIDHDYEWHKQPLTIIFSLICLLIEVDVCVFAIEHMINVVLYKRDMNLDHGPLHLLVHRFQPMALHCEPKLQNHGVFDCDFACILYNLVDSKPVRISIIYPIQHKQQCSIFTAVNISYKNRPFQAIYIQLPMSKQTSMFGHNDIHILQIFELTIHQQICWNLLNSVLFFFFPNIHHKTTFHYCIVDNHLAHILGILEENTTLIVYIMQYFGNVF